LVGDDAGAVFAKSHQVRTIGVYIDDGEDGQNVPIEEGSQGIGCMDAEKKGKPGIWFHDSVRKKGILNAFSRKAEGRRHRKKGVMTWTSSDETFKVLQDGLALWGSQLLPGQRDPEVMTLHGKAYST